MIRIEIEGPITSKKNQWRRRWKGVGLSASKKAEVDAVTWRLIAAWAGRPPLRDETIVWRFWSPRKDRDNLYTTMLDCMKAAGMIEDDRAEKMNGRHVLEPLIRDPVERLVLEIHAASDSEP